MTRDWNAELLQNTFVSTLMESRIDQAAYNELVRLLDEMSKDCKRATTIDKSVALILFTVVSAMRDEMARLVEDGRDSDADALSDMLIEIDRLVSEECLASAD